MDLEKNDSHEKTSSSSFGNILILMIYHLLVSIILIVYIVTTFWFLQQIWSLDDRLHYQLRFLTTKFTFSIRSFLLLSFLQ
ncbi:hypothetical protein I4U23_021051 [Adineta vaga]|nr:hypothetical protein I4U23_021051 [Adineta vaga]